MKITGNIRIEPGEGLGIAGITLDDEYEKVTEFINDLFLRVNAQLIALAETEARIAEAA